MASQLVADVNVFAVGYSGVAMGIQTTLDRFLFRVNALLEERDLNQKDLRGSKSEGWISNIMRGDRNLKLNDAAGIAERLNVPLTELLRRPEDAVYELDNLEARVIEAFRQLSKPEQDAFVTIVTLRHRPGMTPLYQEGVQRRLTKASGLQKRSASHERRPVSPTLRPALEAIVEDTARRLDAETRAHRQAQTPPEKVSRTAEGARKPR